MMKSYKERVNGEEGERTINYFEDILYCVVSRIGFAHIEQIPFLYAQPIELTKHQLKRNRKAKKVQTHLDNT